MVVGIGVEIGAGDVEYIWKKSLGVDGVTPRSLKRLREVARRGLLVVARDGRRGIVGWLVCEPLWGRVYELGMAYIDERYRGRGILSRMVGRAVAGGGIYVFATFDRKILDMACREHGFRECGLGRVVGVSRGRFVVRRLMGWRKVRAVGRHLAKRRAFYGVREGGRQ
jgi:GNAT superfamily N-acetyltransferase